MTVVGIWIAALCTAPQVLGNYLWSWSGYTSDLPLRHLLQVGLNAIAVLLFIFMIRRSDLLVPRRPRRPIFILFLLPLIIVNFARGPLVEFDRAFYLVTFMSVLLTGFWEEFLFRGLIQDRLSVLGHRWSLLSTALLFSFIHGYSGVVQMFVAFSIGLAFSIARDRVGLWPLVFIHCMIDFTNDLFLRRWASFHVLALLLIGAYFILGTAMLIRMKKTSTLS